MTEDRYGRRSTDVEVAELNERLDNVANTVHEVKRLLETNYVPRIKDLEDWRLTWAATELEREKNRSRVQQNAISKRELKFAVISIVLALLATTGTLIGVVLSNT